MSTAQEDTTHRRTLLFNPITVLHKHDWSPHLFHETVRPVLKKSIGIGVLSIIFTTLMTMISISLLFGSSWNPSGYLYQVPVAIINHDASLVGNFIQYALTNTTTFAWVVNPGIADPQSYVNDAHVWAAVYIHHNYSTVLNSSLQNNTPYNNYVQVIYDQGRANTGATLIFSTLNAKITAIAQQFATLKFAEYAPLAVSNNADPRTVINPIQISVINLHPVAKTGQETACTLMFVIVFILCTAIVGGVRQTWLPFATKIMPYQLTIIRVAHIAIQTLFGSLIISLICFAFGAEFVNGFVPYWMIVWLTMMVFCAAVAFFTVALGLVAGVIVPIFLLLMYTSSTGIMPHELDNGFFYLGYALPFYHAVVATRFIMFGSHNQIGINVGVLLAWLIILIILVHIANVLTIAQMLRNNAPDAIKSALKANNVIGNQVESDTASQGHNDPVQELQEIAEHHDEPDKITTEEPQ